MQLNNIPIIPQFPSLDDHEIQQVENELFHRFGYATLPMDYKEFLKHANGCFFDLPDEELVTIQFTVPFLDVIPIEGIFGIWRPRFQGLPHLYKNLPELFASNENSKENFDVLPEQMLSFAYEDEGSGSLYAMSLDERNYVHVYLYSDMYMYSILGRQYMLEHYGYCFYDRRVQHILLKYGISPSIVTGSDSGSRIDVSSLLSQYANLPDACRFELERYEFILLAHSFTEFTAMLTQQSI